MTFTSYGEEALPEWMDKNAWVTWITHEEPWVLEHALIESLSLPLNIQDNSRSKKRSIIAVIFRVCFLRLSNVN